MRSWPLLQTLTLAILLVACLGMGGLVYAELTWPAAPAEDVSAPAARAPTPRPQHDEIGGRFSLPPLQSFAAITERPLFSQSRRPPPQGTEDASGPWSSFVLTGVIISATDREALILHGRPQTIAHLHEGQDVEGWVITSIQPDRVVIRGATSEHVLKLLDKAAPAAAPNVPPRRFNP